MSVRRKKNTQKKVIGEIKNQLLIQAERLGIRDDYNPVVLEELKLDSIGKIMSDFYMERANLEYELNMLASNKKEIMIKLEKLNAYIRKGQSLRKTHNDKFEQLIEKGLGDARGARAAVAKLKQVRVREAA